MKPALPAAVLAASLSSCGISSTVSITGAPRTPRGESCDLALAAPADLEAGGRLFGQYDLVGVVHVGGAVGAQPTDPNIKAELRPLACKIGGEVIVPTSSRTVEGAYGNQIGQELSFSVFAKRAVSAVQKY